MGRFLVAVAVCATLSTGSAYVARPGWRGGMFSATPWWWSDDGLAAIGVMGAVLGLMWIVRIHRDPPGSEARTWRYHDLD